MASVAGPAVNPNSHQGDDKPLLVLHFDVNETIMVGDPAGGDTFEHSLNKIVCKSAFCLSEDPDTWHTGEAIISGEEAIGIPPPPLHTGWEWPDGCAPIYRKLTERADKVEFTDRRGVVYRPLKESLEKALRWPEGEPVSPELCHDGTHHFLIPAFFRTLAELIARGRRFRLVVRTFGTDGPKVSEALAAFAHGKHCLHRGITAPSLALDETGCYLGRYADDGTFTLTDHAGVVISNEDDVVRLVNGDPSASTPTVISIQDDYKWWKAAGYQPSAGKPLWITENDRSVHHIFFDDNIHNDANDSIVAARRRPSSDAPFKPVSGEDTLALQGTHLVRVPTLEPILDHDWFLKQIDACEARFASAAPR